MSGSTPNGNYRDELIAIIKDIGQELIDRAEEMVHEDATFIKDFHIDIDIPNPREEDPTITWHHSTLCTNFINRMDPSKGLKSRIIKEEKTAYWLEHWDPILYVRFVECSDCGHTVTIKGRSESLAYVPDKCPNCNAAIKGIKCDT